MAYCANKAILRSSYNTPPSVIQMQKPSQSIENSRTYITIQPLRSQPPPILPRSPRHNSSNLTGLLLEAFITMANIDNPAMAIQQALPIAPNTYNPHPKQLAMPITNAVTILSLAKSTRSNAQLARRPS